MPQARATNTEFGLGIIGDLINQEIGTITFKSVNSLGPQYLIDLFARHSQFSSHNLKSTASAVQLPKKRKIRRTEMLLA